MPTKSKKKALRAKVKLPVRSQERDTDNPFMLPPKLVGALADEVAKTLVTRLPNILPRPRARSQKKKKGSKIEYGIFLDTSAIIDGRIFDVIDLGLLNGVIVVPQSILLELKHLADSQDMVKRERGRKGLSHLDQLKRSRKMKIIILDEINHKGKIITCDYNLEKKATIDNVLAINVNALANALKVIAVPGESLHIKLLHPGKDLSQGVGYLEDGTMIVVEEGSDFVGRTIDVVVSRVIQTATGRILFAKKI
ncbi:MAG: hypothetical protein HZC02_02730 [Candidatus Levybacteria bacterium]|nr:hypothetical protein [Candidatus Levybacteria bacterium]